jgi:hypothetical protein
MDRDDFLRLQCETAEDELLLQQIRDQQEKLKISEAELAEAERSFATDQEAQSSSASQQLARLLILDKALVSGQPSSKFNKG